MTRTSALRFASPPMSNASSRIPADRLIAAVQYIFDSDLTYGTKYRDSLLFALTLYDVNTGKNRLRELYAAVPGIRKSLLGVNAKQFGERFHHLQMRISRHSSSASLENADSDKEDERSAFPAITTG
ncbi:hypothetical protein DICVIV_05048 [Dictyocaulus viviparus]|uniref:Uncharacterized protein n=1 Tax=Dictyocaulus viviparus TaxID=29172 RepID=A0A0D8XW49_DICVI|nr:hypothetical protein DICVIV_05048 [Dictyocaulus viviparus]